MHNGAGVPASSQGEQGFVDSLLSEIALLNEGHAASDTHAATLMACPQLMDPRHQATQPPLDAQTAVLGAQLAAQHLHQSPGQVPETPTALALPAVPVGLSEHPAGHAAALSAMSAAASHWPQRPPQQPPQQTCCGCQPAMLSAAAQHAASQPAGQRGDTFFKWLLDMLPQPILVRSSGGAILYANRAAARVVDVPPIAGERIEPWQVTPRSTMPADSTRVVDGEADLPRGPIQPWQFDAAASGTAMGVSRALPPPSAGHAVMLQARNFRTMLVTMYRIPFWLVDRRGTHHAVVLYVANG